MACVAILLILLLLLPILCLWNILFSKQVLSTSIFMPLLLFYHGKPFLFIPILNSLPYLNAQYSTTFSLHWKSISLSHRFIIYTLPSTFYLLTMRVTSMCIYSIVSLQNPSQQNHNVSHSIILPIIEEIPPRIPNLHAHTFQCTSLSHASLRKTSKYLHIHVVNTVPIILPLAFVVTIFATTRLQYAPSI